MANLNHIAKLGEGAEAWNEWRGGEEIVPDLSEADLSGKDLSKADLRGADLRGVSFSGSILGGADLRECDLRGADLSEAKGGLTTEQLAGSDLTGCNLPGELQKLYDGLQNVNSISESARKLFLTVLGACLYSWLTIATTKDVNLITNRASSPLPIIQTSIPIVAFYEVAPLFLLCVYFYLHFYLQKLWEELGSLPAFLPDGRPLYAKIDPWLLNDLVRSHLPKLNVNRPFLSYVQLWISVLLAWWLVPITLFLFWGRYLPRHERAGTTLHVALLIISITAALRLYQLAIATLRGAERKRFRWWEMTRSRLQTTAVAALVGALLGTASWGARWGVPSNAPILGIPLLLQRNDNRSGRDYLTLVPRLMALVGYSPFADLRYAELSQKLPTWTKNDKNLNAVVPAQLKGANLRYALAEGAFLSGADLTDAQLSGIDLIGADVDRADLSDARLDDANLSDARLNDAKLYYADLRGADLESAELDDAKLFRATLRGANLDDASLEGADLEFCDLRRARNMPFDNIAPCPKNTFCPSSAKYPESWWEALYDDPTQLDLPQNNNDKVRKDYRDWVLYETFPQPPVPKQAPPAPSSPKAPHASLLR